jgi:hypothetical protein
VPFSLFADDLEPEPQGGWVFFSPTGGSWSLLTSADPADHTSPVNSWHVPVWETALESRLLTPTFSDLPSNTRLRFQHRFKTENNTDGGVLEYSLDDGANWHDINHDLTTGEEKNRFVANGYTGHIAALGGRAAWEDDSGGWLQVEVDLSDFAGETLRLRFLLATDSGNTVDVDGWYLDDIVLERLEYDCTVLAQTPGAVRELRLGKTAEGAVRLDWQPPAPADGGAVLGYTLQSTPLGPVDPAYVTELGAAPHAELDASVMADGLGFLVVGWNTLGTGSTGTDSLGQPRPPADPAP